MAKFVIHKRGFFYTDESFEAVKDEKGSIVGTFNNLEEAKIEKEKQDIISVQELGKMKMYVEDFFFHYENYDEVYKQFEDFFNSEFNLKFETDEGFVFPKNITHEQAKRIMEILDITFHDIVEYDDNVELNPEDFNLEECDLGEF